MQRHSQTAWLIAVKYSSVLASETRDLARAIDVALATERERCASIVLGTTRSDVEDTALRAIAKEIREAHVTTPKNCEAPNGAGHTTADCPGEECRRTGECQVA